MCESSIYGNTTNGIIDKSFELFDFLSGKTMKHVFEKQ